MFLAGLLVSTVGVYATTITLNPSSVINFLQKIVLTDSNGVTGIVLNGVGGKGDFNQLCLSGGTNCITNWMQTVWATGAVWATWAQGATGDQWIQGIQWNTGDIWPQGATWANWDGLWSTWGWTDIYYSNNVWIWIDTPQATLHVSWTVLFWDNNSINHISSFSNILWGMGNSMANGSKSTIIGWSYNKIDFADIDGSSTHLPSKDSVIAGWSWNLVKWSYSSILWWLSNTISGHNKSYILGWELNAIDALWTYAIDGYETIINGYQNEIKNSYYSTILWWQANKIINSNGSIIAWGYDSTINWYNWVFIWSDSATSPFNAVNDYTFLINATNGVGINTNNPQATLDVMWTGRFSNSIITNNIVIGEVLENPIISSFAGELFIKWSRWIFWNGGDIYINGWNPGGWPNTGNVILGNDWWNIWIWTNNPQVMLDVNWSIRPEVDTHNSPDNACNSNTKWSIVYNNNISKLCYCDGSTNTRKVISTDASCLFIP